ncbi:MAG: ABC transporter ATP-binding protein [Bacteroidales bacterium]|nr:ABC transporter ATP-binding protein [Bacteroidales bacterium]
MLNTDNTVIKAENITYKVKDKTILSDISFAVGKGTLTSIVGMNGSGKTTLLKLIGGIIKPVSGYVSINNKNVNAYKVKELAQNVSMVFQSNETDFDFSALQIVLMGRMPYQKLLDRDKAEDFAVCEQAMKETNTWQLKDRLINSLSGGERQRVFIARSLAQQTNIMLLDEPVANLDLKHQIEIMNLLKQIQKQSNATILIVLHDLSLALKYSDNVLALKNGRLHFFDCAGKVLNEENIPSLFEINAKIVANNNVIIQ